jgi:hypothetical protein
MPAPLDFPVFDADNHLYMFELLGLERPALAASRAR